MESQPQSQKSSGRPRLHQLLGGREFPEASTWDLGCAFLARLKSQTDHASMSDHEAHLALLESLHDQIEARREVWQNQFAVTRVEVSLRFVLHAMRRHGLSIAGTTCVELGCGATNPLARLFPLLMLGARQVQGFELEPPRHPDKAVRFLASLVAAAVVDPRRLFGDHPVDRLQLLSNVVDFDLAKLARGEVSGIPESRAKFVMRSIDATGLANGSADLLLSNSVLEHLPDPDACLAEFARITPSGGFGIHGIDVIDHRSYVKPDIHQLEFLTIAGREPIVFECNRLRLHEFEALFARHGFAVLDQWRGQAFTIPDDVRRRMVEPWRSMSTAQLEYGWSQFLVRKN